MPTSDGYRAFDSVCYHGGGPLAMGDIEEIPGDGGDGGGGGGGGGGGNGSRTCVKCPWHSYLIDLETGKKWYKSLEPGPNGKLVPAGWKSTEVRLEILPRHNHHLNHILHVAYASTRARSRSRSRARARARVAAAPKLA